MSYIGNYYNLNNFNVRPNFGNLGYTSTPNESTLAPLEKDTFTKTATTTGIHEFDPERERTKSTWYREDGKTIERVEEINPETKVTKVNWYEKDGKTIKSIDELDPATGKITYYEKDGKTIKSS